MSLVYKLVARARNLESDAPLEPVAKRSVGKPSRGGRKWALRRLDEQGTAVAEEIYPYEPQVEVGTRPMLRPLVFQGEPEGRESVRSEEHTSELQSRFDLVCRLQLEHKKP